jgi:hypothetical protein
LTWLGGYATTFSTGESFHSILDAMPGCYNTLSPS